MSELSEVELEFCRECLGWESPCIDTEQPTISQVRGADDYDFFHNEDLNAAIKAVRGWCEHPESA
jgi:hypothetical protein